MQKLFKGILKREELSFIDALKKILELTKQRESIKLRQIFTILAGKGYAALLILFSFPFCIPIQIPGFSTPFGLFLAFIGLRLAFAKRLWWPKWILEKKISSDIFEKLTRRTMTAVQRMQKILKPRLIFFTKSPFFHCLNGLMVFFLALFLSLPLPIPMTNLLAALPILCIGLGLLENDGIAILIGYILAFITFSVFIGLFLLGRAHFAPKIAGFF